MGRSVTSATIEKTSFVIGQDPEGHWIAVETHGRGGGLFADRSAAMRYARFETEHRPKAVRLSRQALRLPL